MIESECPLCGLIFSQDPAMQLNALEIERVEGPYESRTWTEEQLRGYHKEDGHEEATDDEVAFAELDLRVWLNSL